MTKNYFLLIALLLSINAFSQNTYDDVYQIFQDKCMACHNNATQIANLDLEGNPKLNWVSVFSKPKNLKELVVLNLINNQLIDLPPNIDQLPNLQVLDVKQNPKINWHSAFTQLARIKSLHQLDISSNNIEQLPLEITQIENLKYLHLGSNPSLEWKEAFFSISKLNSLETLILKFRYPASTATSSIPSLGFY